MASTNCWRCLARPSTAPRVLGSMLPTTTTIPSSSSYLSPLAAAAPTAAFTTSAARLAPPKPGSRDSAPGMSKHIRAGKRLVLGRKKKRQPEKMRPVAPGERKAFRKRIQLSNDNALEVEGLPPLRSAADLANPDAVGRIVGLPPDLVDQLRAVDAFKPTQNWGLFRSPHMLIRRETVDLVGQLRDAIAKKETARIVLTGERGSGKSLLALQAISAAFMSNWVVVNIPEAQELTTAHTEYSPIPNTPMYTQPVYTVKLMQAILKANQQVLSQHRVEMDHMYLPVTVSRGMSLAGMLGVTREPEFAWPLFQAFWRELLRPGRPPILFALDGLHHAMRVSDYRSPAFELIHSHDLTLVRLYAEALGGRHEFAKAPFANGAVVLATTSRGNCPQLPTVEKALEQAAALQAGVPEAELPARDPFYRFYDERVFDAMRGVRVLPVRGVSRPEARALLEYWAASGILRLRIDEASVAEKWTLAGGGLLAEMERVSLYDSRLTL